MGSKRGPKATDLDADSFDDFEDDFEDDFDDNLGNLKNLSRDFYSTDWEDPSERFSTRRKIERRKDLRDLYSQFDDGDELDFGNEW